MLFSRKNKKGIEFNYSKVRDKVAKGIAGFLLSIQNRFASFMSAITNNLNKKAKQVYLAIFCLVFGGLSLYAFIEAFQNSERAVNSIKPAQISMPKYYDRTGTETEGLTVSDKEINRINRFKKYMDSLSHSVKGRGVYDSILKARPGLMDSIKIIEQLYYSQSK